jgi:hypothetical protein
MTLPEGADLIDTLHKGPRAICPDWPPRAFRLEPKMVKVVQTGTHALQREAFTGRRGCGSSHRSGQRKLGAKLLKSGVFRIFQNATISS